jgi:hypothetical protein
MKQAIYGFILLILVSFVGGLFVLLITLPFYKSMVLFLIYTSVTFYCAVKTGEE